jgi:hypothetical protein
MSFSLNRFYRLVSPRYSAVSHLFTAGGKVLRWFIVIAGVALSAHTLSYLNFDPESGFLRLKKEAVATGWYMPAYYAHIFAGAVVLCAGFLQFSKRIRKAHKTIHRIAGYIYVVGIVLLAAPGGMIMAFFIGRGSMVLFSFLLQCALWFYFTIVAWRKVLQKDIVGHESFMTRSFALTLAAITLRIYIFFTSPFLDMTAPMVYGIFAWLSWLPNLFIAEAVIHGKAASRREATKPAAYELSEFAYPTAANLLLHHVDDIKRQSDGSTNADEHKERPAG